ncbi:uncharacterized protein K452DRAFT_351410 [Aplosporella prunicola CBS 121167]|uniref:Genetic interactor of prohibitins 3, mitochondrial n=1 Tax=Aplosporella prunicola CBS 121167 TaxID=1176127 RepID=A0A6A6BEA3_9PEZI|nr:uncharacterized protein K452DRAFT_351410 [Aplosporella prunicola CBS 121167]KAF2141257.1 hypothetical protein K452DRAFT_351410 [Aplosporella prunicola CBS 121167]
MQRTLLALSRAEVRRLEASFPLFLCPALLESISPRKPLPRHSRSLTTTSARRQLAPDAASAPPEAPRAPPPQPQHLARALPPSCPGCGAPTQTVAPGEAGFYSDTRNAVKAFLNPHKTTGEKKEEDKVFEAALGSLDEEAREQLGLPAEAGLAVKDNSAPAPICDRCHNLIHHHAGVPINHPSITAIEATISESPHKYNHIYHVVDAVDFPMSLVPNLTRALSLQPLRTQNRRSKKWNYSKGRVAEVSFIITRSDLLAPKKEQVDSLMPYLQEVLRDALGNTQRNVRLGNVRCVSSKRGWWTKEVKEAIWERGGGGWLVGKANVGKSNLFEVVFPKNRNQPVNFAKVRDEAKEKALQSGISKTNPAAAVAAQEQLSEERSESQDQLAGEQPENQEGRLTEEQTESRENATEQEEPLSEPQDDLSQPEQSPLGEVREPKESADEPQDTLTEADNPQLEEGPLIDEDSLLPAAQPEVPFPQMPVISSLPGTTASPIRIPFGRGRGELIDLPGLARSTLDTYVKPEHRQDLIMETRIVPERLSVKPGQSVLLGGGLIRITPTTRDVVYLVHAFVPPAMKPHITSTEKAVAIQAGTRDAGIPRIALPDAARDTMSAGRYMLRWDVTRRQAGPLTARDAIALRPEQLSFVVWSTDVLIEGVGWIEIVAQTSKTRPIERAAIVPPNAHEARATAAALSASPPPPAADDGATQLDALSALLPGSEVSDPSASPPTRSVTGDVIPHPEIEIFSPRGRAWLLGGPKPVKAGARKSRPRISMVSVKQRRGKGTPTGGRGGRDSSTPTQTQNKQQQAPAATSLAAAAAAVAASIAATSANAGDWGGLCTITAQQQQ